MLPTKLNRKLKPFVGKDFDMNIVEDDQTLSVTLTEKKQQTKKESKETA